MSNAFPGIECVDSRQWQYDMLCEVLCPHRTLFLRSVRSFDTIAKNMLRQKETLHPNQLPVQSLIIFT